MAQMPILYLFLSSQNMFASLRQLVAARQSLWGEVRISIQRFVITVALTMFFLEKKMWRTARNAPVPLFSMSRCAQRVLLSFEAPLFKRGWCDVIGRPVQTGTTRCVTPPPTRTRSTTAMRVRCSFSMTCTVVVAHWIHDFAGESFAGESADLCASGIVSCVEMF